MELSRSFALPLMLFLALACAPTGTRCSKASLIDSSNAPLGGEGTQIPDAIESNALSAYETGPPNDRAVAENSLDSRGSNNNASATVTVKKFRPTGLAAEQSNGQSVAVHEPTPLLENHMYLAQINLTNHFKHAAEPGRSVETKHESRWDAGALPLHGGVANSYATERGNAETNKDNEFTASAEGYEETETIKDKEITAETRNHEGSTLGPYHEEADATVDNVSSTPHRYRGKQSSSENAPTDQESGPNSQVTGISVFSKDVSDASEIDSTRWNGPSPELPSNATNSSDPNTAVASTFVTVVAPEPDTKGFSSFRKYISRDEFVDLQNLKVPKLTISRFQQESPMHTGVVSEKFMDVAKRDMLLRSAFSALHSGGRDFSSWFHRIEGLNRPRQQDDALSSIWTLIFLWRSKRRLHQALYRGLGSRDSQNTASKNYHLADWCVAISLRATAPDGIPHKPYAAEVTSCSCPAGWTPCDITETKTNSAGWKMTIDKACMNSDVEGDLLPMSRSSRDLTQIASQSTAHASSNPFATSTNSSAGGIKAYMRGMYYVDCNTSVRKPPISNPSYAEQCEMATFVLCKEVEPACALSEWSAWSSCSVPCGNGTSYRWRRPLVRRNRSDAAPDRTDPLNVTDACRWYHMEEESECSMPPCNELTTETQCQLTTLDVSFTGLLIDKNGGSCSCGSGYADGFFLTGEEMTPCTKEEALVSLEQWKLSMASYCIDSLGLSGKPNRYILYSEKAETLRAGIAGHSFVDCTGGWGKIGVWDLPDFCRHGAKVLCRPHSPSIGASNASESNFQAASTVQLTYEEPSSSADRPDDANDFVHELPIGAALFGCSVALVLLLGYWKKSALALYYEQFANRVRNLIDPSKLKILYASYNRMRFYLKGRPVAGIWSRPAALCRTIVELGSRKTLEFMHLIGRVFPNITKQTVEKAKDGRVMR